MAGLRSRICRICKLWEERIQFTDEREHLLLQGKGEATHRGQPAQVIETGPFIKRNGPGLLCLGKKKKNVSTGFVSWTCSFYFYSYGWPFYQPLFCSVYSVPTLWEWHGGNGRPGFLQGGQMCSGSMGPVTNKRDARGLNSQLFELHLG